MRIRTRSEFQRSRRDGKSFGGKFLVLSVLPDPVLLEGEGRDPGLRFGIILTKKVGNAVVRNRVRRRVRGLLSQTGQRILPGHQLVVIARYTAPAASYSDLERDWLNLLRRAKILAPEGGGSDG